jgi:ankyrin repeat protein
MLKFCLNIALYGLVAACLFHPPASRAQSDVAVQRALNVDDDRTIRRWLAGGGDPNRLDERGQTPLIAALRDESFKVAAALLESPALRIDATNHAGETALMMAALRGQLPWVQRLAAAGAAIHREGWTPLHYAASGGGFEVVRWLLEQGAPIDAPSPNRSTALMMAARYGASESVELLLARGADPRLRNDRGLSAADFARGAGRDALAERLTALQATSPAPRP